MLLALCNPRWILTAGRSFIQFQITFEMSIIYGLYLLGKKKITCQLKFLFVCLLFFCTMVILWCSRLAKNLKSSGLSFLSSAVISVCHHTKLEPTVPASSYLPLLLLFLPHFLSLLLLPPKSWDISCSSLHGWVPA